MSTTNPFYMAGTEGTGEYTVAVVTNRARVGFRNDAARGVFRVRVEPVTGSSIKTLAASFPTPTWKQVGDDDETRFSTTVANTTEDELRGVVEAAVKAVTRFARTVQVNPDAPEWARGLATDKVAS